ncbi:MAG TPA: biopolymer transporter ExbD [Gemmatimonadaceae bacterium]|jgi:biopolymer transport protein ExbD|nr:biopolymer transporter ExbD [Gemmatimonadaceae bacterium]
MPRRRHRDRFDLNADVNVVSLIDVMLLLLVIFMITAPMMQGGVDINLPQADAKPMEAKDALAIAVRADGSIVVDGNTLTLSQFRAAATAIAGNRSKDGVYLRADKNVPYGEVAQLIVIMTNAGITNIGFMMEPEEIR